MSTHFHQTLCALILWRSGLGLWMGKFRQFFTELSACDRSIFSFWDDSFSINQWIFTKLGVCIDIVQICSGIADRQVSSIFDSYLPVTCRYFHFRTITLVNINGFSLNFVCALTLWTSALGLLMVEFLIFLTALSARTFRTITWVYLNGFSPHLMCALILWRSALGLLINKILSIFDRVNCPQYNNGRVLLVHILFLFWKKKNNSCSFILFWA